MVTRFSRLFMAVLILAVLALSLPAPVSAAAVPTFRIISIKADDSVTVRYSGLPANVDFTVRMDVAGNKAIDGIVVKEFNSGNGGSLDATYAIPGELKGKKTIAIRFDSSKGGYYAYDWFNNRTQTSTDTTTTENATYTGGIPSVAITGVDKNKQITVVARNLEPDTNFSVRVGPFYNFSRQGVVTQTFSSGKGGKVVFNVNLPDVVKDVELVAIRIDGGSHFAYNAFTNEDSGTLSDDDTTTSTSSGYTCSVVSVTPSSALPKSANFDAVWEVKNTGSKDWSGNDIDYKFISGTKMYNYNNSYDLHKAVKSGDTVKVTVDMTAPNTTGWYETNWAMMLGSSKMCTLSLTIRVK